MSTLAGDQLAQAARELARMRASLTAWLRYRMQVDAVAAKPGPGQASAQAQQQSRAQHDAILAGKIRTLLAELVPAATLPTAGYDQVLPLAKVALTGDVIGWPTTVASNLLAVVVQSVTQSADRARELEHAACVRAGACPDYGFWVRAAALVGLGYLAYRIFYGRRT